MTRSKNQRRNGCAQKKYRGDDQRIPRAGDKRIRLAYKRSKRGDAEDAACLPRCVEDTRRDAGLRLVYAAEQCRHEGARDMARNIAKTETYQTSRRQRKKVEMLFAHLKRILKLDRLRLRGPNGARDEFPLAPPA